MKRKDNKEFMLKQLQSMAGKTLTLIKFLKIRNIFLNVDSVISIDYVKVFIDKYYEIDDIMPNSFYELILYHITSNNLKIFKILEKRKLMLLISYLNDNNINFPELEQEITCFQYYSTSGKYINRLRDILKTIPVSDEKWDNDMKDEMLWNLRKRPCYSDEEYTIIAYKIYLSIGFQNALELLGHKYGNIDYEKIYYMFINLDVKKNKTLKEIDSMHNYLFNNSRDYNNPLRLLLNGEFNALFLNFDYFYNHFSFFINYLGTKMNKSKIELLLKDRFLTKDVENPDIARDVFDDMLSSYYSRYDFLDTKEDEIYSKNLQLYNQFLRKKYSATIPSIIVTIESYVGEVLRFKEPRNLVMGYRAGNCFRFNGDAAILYRQFLKSEHMRIISISTDEYKDFAMMLVMRNGNVLISQGIEVSKRVPSNVCGKKLYDACREIMKKLMDYMNFNGDNVVATVIGCSNSNVSSYNNQILPFIINPILENSNNYYNGIYNYQCLLDLKDGCSLNDIKAYIPTKTYLDKREIILRRFHNTYENYMEIEKRLISLRCERVKDIDMIEFYRTLSSHHEICTSCNVDWYITLFDDGEIDGFVNSDDPRANVEYEQEIQKMQEYCSKMKSSKKIKWLS